MANELLAHTDMCRDDVEAAAEWLRDRVVDTPVVRSTTLDRIAGTRLWLKAENLQTGGSYKFRGALRAVSQVARRGGHRGVIAQSTGNHALAVAIAAERYGLSATAVLPIDAPVTKVDSIKGSGARVELAGTTVRRRLEVVDRLRAASGDAVLDAYDHPGVIAGQGSATWDLVEEVERRGASLDAVVVPVGGGGGVAGACLALQGQETAVYGVEPVGCDSMTRSLAAGRRIAVSPAPTLADGLRPSLVGRLPFGIVQDRIAGVVPVDDDDIGRAVCLALFHAKLLLEPSGAAGLAGALRLAARGSFTDIGVVLTGGNAEAVLIARLVAGYGATARTGSGRKGART
ncbi:threonine ammonia-lyase [Phytohabitans suffuscus]|uniref:Serine/threonine dehydratase n=1 Tax=Phytohabitans suffuscus TaxID=624315 RepID=A0A6F8YA47_9ACTN|nr:pyridoxal-phosphate dependent enzyme [Phytohabitans suffuscus]BCB83004.1 serine/threonine dehydratase [Phytohabitans suffuscus]